MNPKLALPLVLSVAAFGIAFQQIQSRSSQPQPEMAYTMEAGTHEVANKSTDVDENGADAKGEFRPDPTGSRLMTPEQARSLIADKMKKQDDSYRRMSRVMVRRDSEFVKVDLHNQTHMADPYFLGSITVRKNVDERVAPIQVDRRTGKINIFVSGRWTDVAFVDSSSVHRGTNPPAAARVSTSQIQAKELKLRN